MVELYPLSKKEFEDLYNKAWENGWVYGKFFQELYDEYLVNWVYFVDYLDVLKGVNRVERMYERVHEKFVIVTANNQQPILIEAEDFYFKLYKEKVEKPGTEINVEILIGEVEKLGTEIKVEILIGEAPPYWKGNAKNKDKSYFYNPNYYEKKGSWITAPLAFKGIALLQSDVGDKTEKLCKLAKTGMFLFDVFPFPIIQDTKIRQAVSGKFPEHIEEYFIPKLESIREYISVKKENITYGFVATTYGSLHLLFGDRTRALFIKFDDNFYDRGIVPKAKVTATKFVFDATNVKATNDIAGYSLNHKKKEYEPTARFKTIYKLICPEAYFEASFKKIRVEDSFNDDEYVKQINEIFENNKIPILMNGSGNVNFTKFFNSPKPSREKFETEE